MTRLQELLAETQRILQKNTQDLIDEDPRLTGLSERCENIHNLITALESFVDNLKKLNIGIEVSQEEFNGALRELNITEITGDNLKNKLEEILQLAQQDIKGAEEEVEKFLVNVRQQETVIANYKAKITALESKVRSSENKLQGLNAKSVVVGTWFGTVMTGIVLVITKYWLKFRGRRV